MRYSQVKQPVATIAGVNNELEKIANSIDDMVSRKAGDGPNTLDATLDANSQRIINLPEPVTNTEPVRKADFDELGNNLRSDVYTAVRDAEDATDAANAAASNANTAANRANNSADAATDAAEATLQALEDFDNEKTAALNQFEDEKEGALSDFENQAELVLQSTGWFPVAGSFQAGGTITAKNQVLFDEDTNTNYSWGGGLPKVVTPGSTVASAGGVGVDKWTDRGDATLKTTLSQDYGSANIKNNVVAVNGLKGLASIPPGLRRSDLRYENDGFYVGSTVGGGSWKWKADEPKSNHNGGTIVDPDRIDVWDGTQGDLATLFTAEVSGTGCFIRTNCSTISPDMFGGSLNQIVDSGAYQSHQVYVDTETTLTAPMELVNRGIDFGRRRGRISFSGVHNPDGAAITLTRDSTTERNHLNGMYAYISADSDVQNMLYVNTPSTKIDWLRVDGWGCPGGIIRIENSWGATLRDVGMYVGGPGPGIVLEGSNGGVSIEDCYIHATGGKGIVVNGGGNSIQIHGIIEGADSPSNPEQIGLEINNGDVCVNAYFENRRVVVNGGSRVYFGPGTTSISKHRMYEINGGDLVIFDGIKHSEAQTPGARLVFIDVEAGMEDKVKITDTCSIPDRHFIRSKSYIQGYYAGENLLTDPYFSNWTDDTFNSYPITFINTYNNSLYRYEKDTTYVQSGKYSLTVYRDGDPSRTEPTTQGVNIDVSEVLPKIPYDGKITLGLWVRMEDVEGFSEGDARVVVRLVADNEIIGNDLIVHRLLLGDGFVFVNGHYTIPEGAEDLRIRVLGSLNVQETSSFTIDRMGIVAGHHPINVPFKM